ncbi:MAG: ATP-binding cassette domain-containing protein, partial [Clostridium sp.]
MKVLELKNINKHYDGGKKNGFHALKDINISFEKGEFIAIIGESGSGKSTLMNLIGGLDSDYNGEIIVEGKSISTYNQKQLDIYRKSKVGFIFQSFNLIPHLSVLDNVTIPMIINGISKSKRKKTGREILKKVGLEKYINKKPDRLSGGQKQRVAIARALVNDPDIIIADEPTGSLDSKNTIQVLNLINDIVKEGKLVIMVTHSEKVASCAHRVVEIKDGMIVQDFRNGKSQESAVDTVNESKSSDKKIIDVNVHIKNKNKKLNIFSAVKLALINMKEKLLRNILISFGASIGIMGVILMLGFGNGIKTYFNSTMDNYVNPMVIEVNMPEEDDVYEQNESIMDIPKINSGTPFEEEDFERLRTIENVV